MGKFINGYGALACNLSEGLVFRRCLPAAEVVMLFLGKTPFTKKTGKAAKRNQVKALNQGLIFC
jgi:hypothetical protein